MSQSDRPGITLGPLPTADRGMRRPATIAKGADSSRGRSAAACLTYYDTGIETLPNRSRIRDR